MKVKYSINIRYDVKHITKTKIEYITVKNISKTQYLTLYREEDETLFYKVTIKKGYERTEKMWNGQWKY